MNKFILFCFCYFFIFHISFGQRNVVLIIADDLGSDYCGFYENHLDTIPMPNIRSLLAKGVRFKNAWSNPLCSPTRAGILTGRYSFRTGVGNAVGGTTSAVLDTAEQTIPRMLNLMAPNTFAKANIGKWHLHLPTPKSNYFFPNQMGYDHFEGNFTGVLNSYTDWDKVTNGVATKMTNYATTETADNAIAWVKKQNKPFFLWLAFNAPHSPFHLPPLNLHSFKNLSSADTAITNNPKPYFKAAMESLDHELGRIFDSLKVINQFENTDFIFIGDNGDDAMVAQNTGGAKGSVYQEGVSVPFLISGPSVTNPNRVSVALVNTQDLFATILELFGFMEWQQWISLSKPVDSKSLMPILKEIQSDIRPWVFTEVFKIPTVSGDGKAMRNKEYKLIDFDNGTQKFFHISSDLTENNDLLKGTLNSIELENYNYLCNEMSKLVGTGGFCSLTNSENSLTVDNQVFPNPFTDFIHLSNPDQNNRYRLLNAMNQTIFNGKNIELQDFSKIASGVYFLEISGNLQQVIKLVKE